MSDAKRAVAEAVQRIRDAGIDVAAEDTDTVVARLSEMTVERTSPCGEVVVIHTGAAVLDDIVIGDGALARYDARRLSDVLTDTVRRNESTARAALAAMSRHDASGGRR